MNNLDIIKSIAGTDTPQMLGALIGTYGKDEDQKALGSFITRTTS